MPKLKDFTPCPDSITKKHGLICSAIWGRIWRYSQGEEGKCTASQQTIADNLGIDRSTVFRHMQTLLKEGLIEDLTPDRKHITHEYRTTEIIQFDVTVSVAENDTGVAENNTSVAENNTKIETRKKKNTTSRKRDDRLDHPSIKTYKGIARLNPPVAIRDRMIDVVGDHPSSVEEWGKAITYWIGHGWRPQNVSGMLDVYEKREYVPKGTKRRLPNAADL